MTEYKKGEVVMHSDKGCQVRIIRQMDENRFGKTYLVQDLSDDSTKFQASEKSLR